MIDLLPNDDQQSLVESIRDVLASEAPLARLRDGTPDDALIASLTGLGWVGLAIPEADGGVGLGLAEEILLFREAGRALVGPGLLAAVLAAHVASASGDTALAAALIGGERRAALMTRDGRHRFDHRDGDLSLCVANDGASLFGGGISAEAVAALDAAATLERVSLPDAGSHKVNGPALPLRATVLTAAILVGTAEAARDMATAYARERHQFGQAIGAFQAIKHRCADMAVGCESAWSLTVLAALALAEGRPDAAFQIASARIVAGNAARDAVEGNIQVHGGMGFTDECDAQLLVKRCHLWLQASGDTRAHKAALMAEPEPVR